MGSGSSRKVDVSPYLIQCFTDAHEGGVACLGVSRDSTLVATGGEDFLAKVWHVAKPDAEALKCICKGHKGYILSLRIFDEFLVTASDDKTLRKWDIENDGEFILEYSGHKAAVNNFILTDDYLLSSSYDKTIRWWQFVTGECLKVFEGHKRSVTPLLFIPAKSNQEDDAPDMHDASEDDMFVSGSSDGCAKLWSLDNARCVRTFAGHESAVVCLETENSHEILFTGSLDNTVRSWVLETGEPLKTFSGHSAPIVHIKVLNKLLFTASSDGTARSWITEFGDCTRTYKGHTRPLICFALSNGIIYTGGGDGTVRAFDVKSGVQKRLFGGHAGAVNAIAILPNGRIFSGSNDGCLIIWDSIGIKSDQALREDRKNKLNSKNENEPGSSKENSPLDGSANSRMGGKASPDVAIDIDSRASSQQRTPLGSQPPPQQRPKGGSPVAPIGYIPPEKQSGKKPAAGSKSIPMADLDDEFD